MKINLSGSLKDLIYLIDNVIATNATHARNDEYFISGSLKIIPSYKQSQTQENNYLIFSIEINIILLYTYIRFSDITYDKKNNKNNLLY